VRLEYNSLDGVTDRLVPLFRAGFNYRLMDYTFLRASFGQGYRFPAIAEKHAATTIGSVRIVPNPEVESESGWSSEVGIKQGIMTGRLNGQVDLALFYSENTGMIEYLFGIYPDPAGRIIQFRLYGNQC
jgi:outer membrane receptor protein involved in Fe transport